MTHIAIHPIFAHLGQSVVRAWQVFTNRRHVSELKHWSDEQLKDIGLTRSDVRRALAVPFYVDPTTVLSSSSAVHGSIKFQAANTSAPYVTDTHGQLAA